MSEQTGLVVGDSEVFGSGSADGQNQLGAGDDHGPDCQAVCADTQEIRDGGQRAECSGKAEGQAQESAAWHSEPCDNGDGQALAGQALQQRAVTQELVTCLGGPYDGQAVWIPTDAYAMEWWDGNAYRKTSDRLELEFDPARTAMAKERIKRMLYPAKPEKGRKR